MHLTKVWWLFAIERGREVWGYPGGVEGLRVGVLVSSPRPGGLDGD